ncbi:hypothetical protein QAD02_015866 [Eretmocerus hayati]|uniref:Uncharacterized protein n=1 Tax=Eretmocerus hayati TaxID=131215 RepID=A0ACC2P900_9HYME|nr:hypothetical protein QAD02_015866 [Eretmocerus hayati]
MELIFENQDGDLLKQLEVLKVNLEPDCCWVMIHKVHNKSNIIHRGKDFTGSLEQTNIVHRLEHNDSNATYAGQTKKKMRDRITEHTNSSKNLTKQNYVIHAHMKNNCHTFNFNRPRISDKEAHWLTLNKLVPIEDEVKKCERSSNVREKRTSDASLQPAPARSEAHQLKIVSKVLVDVSNTHVTGKQLCPESIDKMDDNMKEIEPGEYVPTTQLKDDLLTMPGKLVSFGEEAVISSDHPSAEDIQSATENGSELVVGNKTDCDQLSTLEHNTSVDQMSMNLSHESESLIIVTKNELLDLKNDLKSSINSSVIRIVENVVDRKMIPQFKIVHLDLKEIRAIAESHSENVDILTFDAFSKLYDFSLKLPSQHELSRFEAAILGTNLKKELIPKYADFRTNMVGYVYV